MKLKNLLVMAMTVLLISSLYAQKENSELQMTNELKILNETSTMPFDFDYTENQESEFDNLIKSAPAEIDSNLAQQLQNVLDEAIIENDIKGLSAAISAPNGDIWKGTSGISHDTVELTTDMLFGIASITKTFMATIIMQLYEADSLKLSDSIYKWLPPFDNIDSTVTIRQLLNHTSGIHNYSTHPAFVDSTFVPGSRIWTPEEILETFVLSPLFPPGTDWEYCNTNYILLGMIIEEITGNEVVSELHNRFTVPLGLNSTFLFPDEGYEGFRSHVWWPTGGDTIDVTDLIDTTMFSAAWTAAALLSTAEDIVKWSKGLNEGEILNDTTLALMREPAPYSGGSYGLGTFIEYTNSQWIYGHNGIMVYYSRVYYVPDDSLSISIISNQRYAPVYDIWHDLYNTYYSVLSGVTAVADPAEICNGSSTQLSVELIGGSGNQVYSWTSIPEGFTSNLANPVASPTEETTYYVEVTDYDITVYSDITVIVNPLPDVTIGTFDGVCVDEGEFALTGGMPEGGEYTGTGVTNGMFDPATAGIGTWTITYTYTNEFGCDNFAEADITVNDLPVVIMIELDTTCVDWPAFELAGGMPEGGVYTGTGVSNGMFDPATAGVGSHLITYTYIDANGCENYAEETIYVDICTGINELLDNITIEVTPNPNNGLFKIKVSADIAEDVHIRILNNLGLVVFEENSVSIDNKYSYDINLSDESKGMYFIHVITDESVYIQKVIVR